MDLMGRIRVRLRAEDRMLVAYGYGGQRIEIPASSVGSVRTVNAYRIGVVSRGLALLVLDKQNQILLSAPGLWETYGEVRRVCRAAGLPSPRSQYLTTASSRYGTTARAPRPWRISRRPPLFLKAPGYRKLRTVPRGNTLRVPALSKGKTTVTDVSTLSFKPDGQSWKTDDPSIGGRPLPLDSAGPEGTSEPLTVVYLPGDPDTAAAAQQLAGSVWHGAPTANVLTGAVFTAALPLLLWGTIRRVRRRRWLRNADLLNDLAKE